jgi:hypothetical protein
MKYIEMNRGQFNNRTVKITTPNDSMLGFIESASCREDKTLVRKCSSDHEESLQTHLTLAYSSNAQCTKRLHSAMHRAAAAWMSCSGTPHTETSIKLCVYIYLDSVQKWTEGDARLRA